MGLLNTTTTRISGRCQRHTPLLVPTWPTSNFEIFSFRWPLAQLLSTWRVIIEMFYCFLTLRPRVSDMSQLGTLASLVVFNFGALKWRTCRVIRGQKLNVLFNRKSQSLFCVCFCNVVMHAYILHTVVPPPRSTKPFPACTPVLKDWEPDRTRTRNLKGGIGSLFDPCVNAMGRGHIARNVWRWVIVPSDLARSFGAICAHYRYRVIHRAITNMRARFKFMRERQLTLKFNEIIWQA